MLPHFEPETIQECLKLFNRKKKASVTSEKTAGSLASRVTGLLRQIVSFIQGK